MKSMILALGSVFCAVSLTSSAFAQQSSATSGGVSGQNTIQQAPSGGRVGGGAASAPGATAARGEPTPDERQTEKHNNDVTQICKGC